MLIWYQALYIYIYMFFQILYDFDSPNLYFALDEEIKALQLSNLTKNTQLVGGGPRI